jgi:hypothetical protein
MLFKYELYVKNLENLMARGFFFLKNLIFITYATYKNEKFSYLVVFFFQISYFYNVIYLSSGRLLLNLNSKRIKMKIHKNKFKVMMDLINTKKPNSPRGKKGLSPQI